MLKRTKLIWIIIALTLSVLKSTAEVITPIPLEIKYNKQKASLGKKLFYDTRLSKDDSISCATCHLLDSGGDGDKQYSFGINAQMGNLNTPTLFNAVFNFAQTRNGKAQNLKEQIHIPITNPIEMGTTYESIIQKLTIDKNYALLFKEAYELPIKPEYINDALAQFQTALITPNSRFDQYLRGDKNALDQDEKEGFKLFKKNGCIACHNGVNLGSNLYQKVGILRDYDINEDNNIKLGRYNVTKNEEDKYLIKVPTLRNIELTAPYLHNGSLETLDKTVRFMFFYQVGITQSDTNIQKIVKFLKTLTGDLPAILKEDNEEN